MNRRFYVLIPLLLSIGMMPVHAQTSEVKLKDPYLMVDPLDTQVNAVNDARVVRLGFLIQNIALVDNVHFLLGSQAEGGDIHTFNFQVQQDGSNYLLSDDSDITFPVDGYNLHIYKNISHDQLKKTKYITMYATDQNGLISEKLTMEF